MKKIILIIPCYLRPGITTPLLVWYKYLKKSLVLSNIELNVLVTGSERFYLRLAEELGFNFAWVENTPLGRKFNKSVVRAVKWAKELDFAYGDRVMICGSDDFLSKSAILAAVNQPALISGFKVGMVLDLLSGEYKMIKEKNRYIGSGVSWAYGFLIESLVEHRNVIYPEINYSLDGPMVDLYKGMGVGLEPVVIITKGEKNIWGYGQLAPKGVGGHFNSLGHDNTPMDWDLHVYLQCLLLGFEKKTINN
ncbi:MAG TPA: hypothetical protein VF985_08555 [Mariniflexile sp.]